MQSLGIRFVGLLTPDQESDTGAGEGPAGLDGFPATPPDYLDEILHVPFHLPPLSEQASHAARRETYTACNDSPSCLCAGLGVAVCLCHDEIKKISLDGGTVFRGMGVHGVRVGASESSDRRQVQNPTPRCSGCVQRASLQRASAPLRRMAKIAARIRCLDGRQWTLDWNPLPSLRKHRGARYLS
jgi:hypothetical protein